MKDFGHGCADYINAVPKMDSRGGMRHYVSVRKHKHPNHPLHPADDFEGALYLLMVSFWSFLFKKRMMWRSFFCFLKLMIFFATHYARYGHGHLWRQADHLIGLITH